MIKAIRPTTNARRKMTVQSNPHLTKNRPIKSLVVRLKKISGRDNLGHISIRHRGGGAKRLYRQVDFKMIPFEGEAHVETIEYDPNRNAHIALVCLPDGTRSYILASDELRAGDKITSNSETKKKSASSRAKLADIPVGTSVFNIELRPGQGGALVRAAGTVATLTAKEGKYAHIRLPSGELRKVMLECMASLGQVSNPTYARIRWAKAGRMRWRGIRPTVRGKAMNPNSHPHGGGEGVNSIGLKHPKTPWGKPALGVRTRKNKRTTQFIINRRKK